MNSNISLVTAIALFRFENFTAKKSSTNICLPKGNLRSGTSTPVDLVRDFHLNGRLWPQYTILASIILVLHNSILLIWKVLSKKTGERFVYTLQQRKRNTITVDGIYLAWPPW